MKINNKQWKILAIWFVLLVVMNYFGTNRNILTAIAISAASIIFALLIIYVLESIIK